MATRRRAAPYILRLGGISNGTGEFFGQKVHTLTTAFQELQDLENLKKFADGDPETFLAYWNQRKDTAKGRLKVQLETYAAQAKKRVATNDADAAALSSYARTNNHQAYLDYLLKKLETETDPSNISRLGTQINELRSRVFATSSASGAVGGGVTQDALVTARDKWNETRFKYEDIVKSRPLTADEVKAVNSAAQEYSTVLKKIIFSTDATQARKDQMNTAYTTSTGPNTDYTDSLIEKSDKKLTAKFKTDADFAALVAPLLATKRYGEVAKMYAQRARDLSLLATQVQGPTQAEVIGNWLNDAEAKVGTYSSQASSESTKMSPESQGVIDDGYSTYWSQQTKLHAKDPAKYKSPLEKGVWTRQLANDATAAQFSTDSGAAYSEDTFKSLKNAATAFGPAQYDANSGKYIGDAAQVANANAADDAIRTAIQVPGGPYEVYRLAHLTDANSIRAIREGTLTPDVAQSLISPTGSYGVAPVEGSPEAAGQPVDNAGASALPAQPTAEGAGPTGPVGPEAQPAPAPADVSSSPMFQTGAKNGKIRGAQYSMATDGYQEDWSNAVTGVDNYLSAYDIADLPDWKPPVDTPKADVNALFPFDSTPPPQTTMAADQTMRGGRPY